MFPKLATLLMIAIVVGAVLLALRQQRLQLMHEMVQVHSQIDRSRQAIWDYQVKITERTEPNRLRDVIARHRLQLEPAVPVQLQQQPAPSQFAGYPE